MGRYKKKRKSEFAYPFPAGPLIHETEIKDTKTGKKGKGLGWTKKKADKKAWDKLHKKR